MAALESSIEPEPTKRQQLDLLLSLDVALEIIHADREALKRIEIFAGYRGHCGRMVHDTIEEISITMFQVLGGQHVVVGFSQYAPSSIYAFFADSRIARWNG